MFSEIISQINVSVNKFLNDKNNNLNEFNSFDFIDKDLREVLILLKQIKQEKIPQGFLNDSVKIKGQLFRNEIYPIVPLYLTNICNQTCLYCNYSRYNTQIKRFRLSEDELISELEQLVLLKGYKTIELVYATDPHIDINKISNHIKITKEFLLRHNGQYVGINAQSFSVDEYKLLKDAGLDFVVLWQETYDEERYISLHPNNREKSDFAFRLNTYESFYDAGIEHIGMGILSGISNDWLRDWTILFLHEAYLKWKYGKTISILGIPRLKGISELPYYPDLEYSVPNDQQFLTLLSIHNEYSPSTFPFINTRESWDLCVKLANGGGCLFTFDCSTYPGGYTQLEESHQFPTYDFEIEEYYNKALSNKLIPKFDWSFPSNNAVSH